MPDQREVVLNYIKSVGPVLPVHIAKQLNTSILFSSAILSELVDRKMVKITHAAIGGSPLYYLAGQEALMDEKLHHSLGGKEKEAYYLIKERKIVRERDLEPWQRVAIKSLVDFTKQILVVVDGENDSFWKHNLVPDEEAKMLIEEYVKGMQQNIITEQVENKVEEVIQEQVQQIEERKIETVIQTEVKEENKIQEQKIERGEIVKEVMKSLKEEYARKEKQERLKDSIAKKEEIIEEVKKIEGKFYNEISRFLEKNEIEIIKEELVKKEKEINFIVDLPSALGKLRYLAVAKSKPIINEADVSMAYAEGQMRKLPVIMIVDGKINKKVELLIEGKLKGQVIIKQI